MRNLLRLLCASPIYCVALCILPPGCGLKRLSSLRLGYMTDRCLAVDRTGFWNTTSAAMERAVASCDFCRRDGACGSMRIACEFLRWGCELSRGGRETPGVAALGLWIYPAFSASAGLGAWKAALNLPWGQEAHSAQSTMVTGPAIGISKARWPSRLLRGFWFLFHDRHGRRFQGSVAVQQMRRQFCIGSTIAGVVSTGKERHTVRATRHASSPTPCHAPAARPASRWCPRRRCP